MPIKSTAQTIHLTCDLCQTIHDRIPVTEGVWYEIAKAGWVLNRTEEKCICPDCIYAQHEQLVEITAVEQLEPFKGYLVYVDCPHYWYWSGFRQFENRFSHFQHGEYGVPAYRDTNHDGVHSMSAVTDHMLEGGPIKIRFATAEEAAVIEMSYGMPMVIKEKQTA